MKTDSYHIAYHTAKGCLCRTVSAQNAPCVAEHYE